MDPPTVPTDSAPASGRRLDPWLEQERRHAAYRAARRKRRQRRSLIASAAVGAVFLLALATLAATGWFDRSDSRQAPIASAVPSTGVPTTVVPATTVPPEQLLGVDEVWLIDRGDRIFDWGVLVRTPEGAPQRSGVAVDVRLIDVDDEVVETTSITLDGVGHTFPGVAAGRLEAATSPPVRLEFDLVVGIPSDEPARGEQFELRALDRSDDRLSGRIRTDASVASDPFGVLFVWRDDDGEVVASVPLEVERIRPGVDARFELDLRDEPLPDGLPDDVFWTG